MRCLIDIFKKITSPKDKEKEFSDMDTNCRYSGNLDNRNSQIRNSLSNSLVSKNLDENTIKLIKEDIAAKLLIKIFIKHYEKIETSGLPLSNVSVNPINKNFNFQVSQINATLNQHHNEKILKLGNDITVCIFKGLNFFSSKYINKKNLIETNTDSENKNKNDNKLNFIFGVEDMIYFSSKAELKIVNRIVETLNKYNFLKVKQQVPAISINISPKNTTDLANTNLSLNANINTRNQDNTNQNNNIQNISKSNFILQRYLIRYSEVKSNSSQAGKADYIEEVLDNIENIVRNFEIIIYEEIIKNLNKIAGYNQSKNDEINDKNKVVQDFIKNTPYYLELFKYIKILSNNPGFTLFLIKSGIYLFVLYFILKFESKKFKNYPLIIKFINDVSSESYFIIKNLIFHVNSFSKSNFSRSTNSNISPQINQQAHNLTNTPTDEINPTLAGANYINSFNINNIAIAKNQKLEKLDTKIQDITLINRMSKIYSLFERVIKNLLQNYFYELILNPISTIANKEHGTVIKLENIQPENQCLIFLNGIKSNIENPDFIWNKNFRKELKYIIDKQIKSLYEIKFQINFNLLGNTINNINPTISSSNIIENAEIKPVINIANISKQNSNSTGYNNNENKSEYEIYNLEHLESFQNFDYLSSKKELKIGKIYIRVYNKNNEFKLENPNKFLEILKQTLLDIEFENFNYKEYFTNINTESIKNEKSTLNTDINQEIIKIQAFIDDFNQNKKLENNLNKIEKDNPYFYYDENLKLNFNVIDELLKAISNVISNSKADETILLNDTKFVEKFYKLLNENINYNKDIQEKIKLSINEDNEKSDIPNKKVIEKKNSNVNIFKNFKQNLNKKIKNSKLQIDRENINAIMNINNLYSNINEFTEGDSNISDLIPSCLNLLYILSMINPESMRFVLNHNIIFIILKIINDYNTKSHVDPIIRILRLIIKNPEFVDRLNISVFLFLLKKIISFRDICTYINEEEKLLNKAIEKFSKKIKIINSQDNNKINLSNYNDNGDFQKNEYLERIKNFQNQIITLKSTHEKIKLLGIDIIKIIKKFIINERIGFAIKGIFEFYLPNKIIDSLFLTKETNETSIKCLGEELELPDLIWNKEAIQQSKRILDEDTIFILNDEMNLDNFPQNLISHKLLPQKCFFFEISDEYRLDNIYIRIFNKDPSYNLGKNLIIFLKQAFNDCLNNYKKLAFFKFFQINNPNKNEDIQICGKSNNKIIESINSQILCGFTAILLIIEQINFNDFNDNLGISSIEEMKNLIKDENEKHLISLVQRSFEYQNLISENFIKKLTNLILSSFGINDLIKKTNKIDFADFFCFNENIRLIFLQILYLLSINKKAINIIYMMLDINDLLDKFYKIEDKISDGNILYNLIYKN